MPGGYLGSYEPYCWKFSYSPILRGELFGGENTTYSGCWSFVGTKYGSTPYLSIIKESLSIGERSPDTFIGDGEPDNSPEKDPKSNPIPSSIHTFCDKSDDR